jgi:hypothetical protein
MIDTKVCNAHQAVSAATFKGTTGSWDTQACVCMYTGAHEQHACWPPSLQAPCLQHNSIIVRIPAQRICKLYACVACTVVSGLLHTRHHAWNTMYMEMACFRMYYKLCVQLIAACKESVEIQMNTMHRLSTYCKHTPGQRHCADGPRCTEHTGTSFARSASQPCRKRRCAGQTTTAHLSPGTWLLCMPAVPCYDMLIILTLQTHFRPNPLPTDTTTIAHLSPGTWLLCTPAAPC